MIMKRNKKGQEALEFLTTYGWAVLVILVMIGALAYFGVLTPNLEKEVPNTMTVVQEENVRTESRQAPSTLYEIESHKFGYTRYINIYLDEKRSVICYVYSAAERGGISCIPLNRAGTLT